MNKLTLLLWATFLIHVVSGCGPVPSPTATVALPEEGAEWDYVVLGAPDCLVSRRECSVELYAEYIERDLGVEVTLHGEPTDNLSSGELLDALRNDQELRDAISEAEVITLWLGPEDTSRPLNLVEFGLCGGEDNADCCREMVASFKANLDAIIAEILSLRSTTDTIIRIADLPNPFVAKWKEQGIFEDVRGPCHDDLTEYIAQAASEHDIPVAHYHLALNGPNGDEDYTDKYTSDGIHFNAAGLAVLADLYRELGYAPLGP
jgi:lysophospholipase L1-like esterase